MLRGLSIATILTCLAGPAFAADCVEPYAPAIANGATATAQQMLSANHDAAQFMRDSDAYQECLNRDLRVQRAEAARAGKSLDPSIVDQAVKRGDANQREKERVGAEYAAAIAAYKAAGHPWPPPANP